MKFWQRIGAVCAAAALLGVAGAQDDAGTTAAAAPKAKNVIVMIADGWGFNQIDAASYYEFGETGQQIYERTFTPLAMSTYSAEGHGYDPEKFWSSAEYAKSGATDSAAAATAMATGIKTYNSAIGMDLDKKPVRNLCEAAEEAGKASGVVTSVPLAHATPAGFLAHNVKRGNYEEIAREMFHESKAEVIMGAGHPWFDTDGKLVAEPDGEKGIKTPQSYDGVGGADTWIGLLTGTLGNDCDGDGVEDKWTLVQSREAFQRLAEGETPKRVAGVAPVSTTLQQERSGDVKAPAGAVPFNESVPTLAEMARAALNVLDNDPDGFFLMIEGGAVDWAGHDNRSGRLIEEVMEFNRAIEAVVEWVEQNSSWDETLVVITGDHETGFLGGPDAKEVYAPVTNNGKGQMPGMEWRSGSHTNSLIPFFAKGPGTELYKAAANKTDPKRGPYLDNTDLAKVVFSVIEP